MSIFEVPKARLLDLTDLQLEELVARLTEAEVSTRGGQISDVTWSGSINAPDGGVDVRAAVNSPDFEGDWVKRANTIFQVKKPRMRPADIRSEMTENGELLQVISEQAAMAGAYIIVSLAEDNAEPERNRRLEAMRNAVAGDPNAPDIAIDFYDRSRLHQWLRSYPGVMLWVREQLGIPLSGWQPHGRWCPTPADVDDTIIFDEGVTVDVPAEGAQGISLEDALQVVRRLVRNTVKSIRIAGLSGVGKTRFVQALFEENTGADALDRTKVIYVDSGADPDPSARSMIDTLIAEGREVTMVLDNCPSDLHAHLASRVANSGGAISLITVEYDIREDKPQTTEVVHIEADGPEISERLVLRRFPGVGQANSRRIAEVANGNARVALAIAERVEAGESLALLSDTDLFNRLFHQRNNPDQNLKERAEVLSLVYSFSVQPDEGGVDELSVLAGLCGAIRMQMFRATATLLDRHVAQKRSHWRAVLPHAVANRLAASALDAVPIETLRETFEHRDRPRLLKSFARRLGYLHEHPVACEIVDAWFAEGGLLSNILDLNELGAILLRNVAPVAPEALLALLDLEIRKPDFAERCSIQNDRRSTITSLLVSLAYETEMFDQCVELLLIIAVTEDPSNNYDSTREKIKGLFQAYLSGSHATLDQRTHIVRECLWSGEPERRAIGAQLLSAALDGPPWNGFGLNEFGSRSRDYGYQPTYEQYDEWMNGFLSVAVDAALSDQNNLSELARGTLANEFRETWRRVTLRPRLIEIANSLNEQQPWVKGWKAVRSTIYFDHKEIDGDDTDLDGLTALRALEESLRPIDLLSEIKAVVFGDGYDDWLIDEDQDGHEKDFSETEKRMHTRAQDLGQRFVRSDLSIDTITSSLFDIEHAPFRHSFGVGLAAMSTDLRKGWNGLLDALRGLENPKWNYDILAGFIEGIVEADPNLARDILNECANDPLTQPIIVGLHPFTGFTDDDLDRCVEVLIQGGGLALGCMAVFFGATSMQTSHRIKSSIWRICYWKEREAHRLFSGR